jgi:hypothetical protein
MTYLESFQSMVHTGTIEVCGYETFPSGLTWVRGNHHGIACRTAGIPTLRVLVVADVPMSSTRFDGMAIDSSHLPRLQTEMRAMNGRRTVRQQRTQGKTHRIATHSRILTARLNTDRLIRCRLVQRARDEAGLSMDVGPVLSSRMDRFESGQSLLEQFQGMMTMNGPDRLTMLQLRQLFPSHRRPSTNLRRIQLISEYTLYCAQRFEITDVEYTVSVNRTRVADRLKAVSRQLRPREIITLTPEDLEANHWRDRTVRSVCGVPWIVREHVFRYASISARPWHPVFVADRIGRLQFCRREQRRSSADFVDLCEDRFINTPICWYRSDPFLDVPQELLELICTFVDRRDATNLIDSSRSLAMAFCRWVRRLLPTDPLGVVPGGAVRRTYTTMLDQDPSQIVHCGRNTRMKPITRSIPNSPNVHGDDPSNQRACAPGRYPSPYMRNTRGVQAH